MDLKEAFIYVLCGRAALLCLAVGKYKKQKPSKCPLLTGLASAQAEFNCLQKPPFLFSFASSEHSMGLVCELKMLQVRRVSYVDQYLMLWD